MLGLSRQRGPAGHRTQAGLQRKPSMVGCRPHADGACESCERGGSDGSVWAGARSGSARGSGPAPAPGPARAAHRSASTPAPRRPRTRTAPATGPPPDATPRRAARSPSCPPARHNTIRARVATMAGTSRPRVNATNADRSSALISTRHSIPEHERTKTTESRGTSPDPPPFTADWHCTPPAGTQVRPLSVISACIQIHLSVLPGPRR